ncbi:MAG: hypothetical protein ACP5G0_01730 [Desulfomonilia bacterium]
MRPRYVLAVGILLLAILCCGRKLPPLPPSEPDPVEIVSIGFTEGEVTVRVRCAVQSRTVTLLGKPKGICPACIEDLVSRDEVQIQEPGTLLLKDRNPDAEYMVYRVSIRDNSFSWRTGPRIVRRTEK